PQACFSPPVGDPPYGLHAQVKPIATKDGRLFLFSAESWAGAKVSLTFVSLLQEQNRQLVNLAPQIVISEEGEFTLWKLAPTEMPVLVVAECIFKDAGEDLSHRYEITSYGYDQQVRQYKQVDHYLTSRRFKNEVLNSEKTTILAR